MPDRRNRTSPALAVEGLEGRVVLSTVVPASGTEKAMDVVPLSGHPVSTQTTLSASAGTLGQPITFTVTVRAPAASGSPMGAVQLIDHGQVVQTLNLTSVASTNPKYAYATATYTLTPQAGGGAYFFGKHTISARFEGYASYLKSTGKATFDVAQPDYATLSDGVKVSTIAPGSGPQIQTGQTASVLYTGYLAKNGKIFDDSVNDGGAPFQFQLGAGQVIPGFDAGTLGMQVGETRIVEIPAAEGYGSTANGPIPANSTLIFVLTLESIS